MGSQTVHCLALGVTDSFIFRNEEVELVIWAGDGSYLILFIDEISDYGLAPWQFFLREMD